LDASAFWKRRNVQADRRGDFVAPVSLAPVADSQGVRPKRGVMLTLVTQSADFEGETAMTFDTPAYIALIGAGSVFIVTIGVFVFLLTRR